MAGILDVELLMSTRQHCAGAIVPAAATGRLQHRHDQVLTDILAPRWGAW